MQTFNYFNDIPKPKIIKITPKSHPEIWEKLQPKANPDSTSSASPNS